MSVLWRQVTGQLDHIELAALVTLLFLAIFALWAVWAYAPSNRRKLEEARLLPFDEGTTPVPFPRPDDRR